MTAIQVRKTAEEPGAASLAVTVPLEQVREAEDRATSSYQRRARLPGFRRGKAPPALVRKHFADDIRQEALQQLIRESWKLALEQEALQPIADPHIHNLKWESGTPVTFEFHVEVKPDLKLERIGKFRLTRTVPPVTEEQVLGEGRAIPEVEERIMGMLPGETVDATVRFPDDFPEEAKRGQSRDIRLTLREVKRQQLPELDDAFAREVGDFDSLEALRAAVREDLERDAAREADAKVRAELIEQIVQANRVVAPRPLVERALYAYGQAYGIPEDRWPQFAQEFRPVAEAQVRRDLILDWVLEHHQLRAAEAALEERLRELAERRGTTAAELRASLEKAKRLRDVERGLTEEKVFAFLLSQSTVEQT